MRELADFLTKLQRLEQVYRTIPQRAGIAAVRFSKERFRQQNWVDTNTEPWKQRKADRLAGAKKQRETKGAGRRGILIKTGRLMRSIRVVRSSQEQVVIGSDVPYARAHNEGVHIRSTASVRAHSRRRFYIDEVSAPGARKEKFKKVEAGTSKVRAHTRKMNTRLPRRQFLGSSAILEKQLSREIQYVVNKALKGN